MLNLPGYHVLALVHEGANSLVYRGFREADRQPLIFKVLKEDYPTPAELNRYRLEYEILSDLDSVGVIKAYALEKHHNALVMALEDCGGVSLKAFLQEHHRLSLDLFLPLAVRITQSLGEVHAANIIHKDLNPSNIVYNPASGETRLIDFGHASILPRENPSLKSPERLEGSLAYMSPEQTGRTHRSLDYRTDFYALGVTFYELLTGQLPFHGDSPTELVHAHLARQPVPPHRLLPEIPPALSDILMKLLAKMPEDRYQSAWGLKADLENCARQWQAQGRIEAFPLAGRDVSDKFHLPQRLYGREAELRALLESFARVDYDRNELALISGYTGIGKTALAQELAKPVAQKNAYFIAGRFEQFQGNLPYSGLIGAFRELARQLLAEPEKQVHQWREKLAEALGSNAQLIVEVIPELEHMLGPQPPVPPLGPAEAQNRFQLAFLHFVQVFCRPGYPLVLFLDDLQWVDAPSLKFLQLLLGHHFYLLVVGAYRDNQVDEAHPLRHAVEELIKAGVPVHHLPLAPLRLDEVNRFLADTFHSPSAQTLPLAELLLAKTNGNPFFLGEYLTSLYAEKLVDFDFREGAWRWDLARIRGRDIAANMVELLAAKVRKLGPRAQAVVKLAAALGTQSGLEVLALAHGKPPPDTAADVWEAVVEGVLIPLDAEPGAGRAGSLSYRFAHDHIQQAAYSLIPEAERPALHWRIGRLLLENFPPHLQDAMPFLLVEQLNLGRAHSRSQAERDELALLNLLAGRQTKAAAAYKAACAYLHTGIDLLGEGAWQRQYALGLALHADAVEAAYLSGNFEEMERLAGIVLERADNLLDKVKVFEVKIQAYSAQNKLLAAVETASAVLRLLGVRLPERPLPRHHLLARLDMRAALLGKRIEDLVDLPAMTDPYQLAVVRILSSVSYAAFRAVPALMPLIIYKLISLSCRHGNTPVSSYAYATYGQQLCAIAGDIATGYRFGNLALRLLERLRNKEHTARTSFIVHGFIRYWREPLRDTLQPLQAAYQTGLENGDLAFAANAAFLYSVHSYYLGRDLQQCERDMAGYSQVIGQLKQKAALLSNNLYRQAVLNLAGQGNTPPYRLEGDSYDERKMRPQHEEANDRTALFQLAFNKLVLSYLFQNYREALRNAETAEQYLNAATGSLPSTLFYFYAPLAYLAAYPDASPAERRAILDKVAHTQKKLKRWARHAPMNFLHKYYLVEAERARVLQRHQDARDAYDRAAALAEEHGYLNDEALAYELAGRFYLERKLGQFAQLCLHNAHYAYSRWGAQAKVQDLAARYPQVFVSTELASGLVVTTTRTSSSLDLASVLKASQTIAGEIVLKRLVDKLMRVVVENAGAQTGYLLLEQDRRWRIEARHTPLGAEGESWQALDLEDCAELPASIVHYVARTKESVVLTDAANTGKFTRDPYILKRQPKSVLCTPLVNQGQASGVLYLENNLTTGAFTAERLEVLNLLSAQMSISLQNARLYANLEEKVAERTRELYEKNEDLVKLNQEKNEFLGIAAHDLKNPLSAIRGLAEEIQESFEDMGKDEILEYAEMIQKAARKMFELITTLLDVNAIESGKMNVDLKVVDVLPIVSAMTEDYRNRAAAKDLVVQFESGDARCPAIVDENTFGQIMDNLISNAVKYSPQGKRISVRMVLNAQHVRCEVQDQGPGLSAEDKQKLFGKFNRLSARPTGGEHSTGLGLFIVKKLVEAMRGRVWCESEPGRGATFIVEFPRGA